MFNFDIISILISLPGILIGLSFHEFAHAYAAVKLGDDTPRFQGRLSLDPLKHLDPIGFLCLIFFKFGWAKPVMINSRNFKDPRRDDTIVSLAGPAMNFLLAILFTGVLKILSLVVPATFFVSKTGVILIEMINSTIFINIVLMVFNLLPIPPLDGHHVLENIGGYKVANFYRKYYQQIRLVLLLLIMTRVISKIIYPIIIFIYDFIFGIFF